MYNKPEQAMQNSTVSPLHYQIAVVIGSKDHDIFCTYYQKYVETVWKLKIVTFYFLPLHQMTPLHVAVERGDRINIMKYLLNKGAAIDVTDKHGVNIYVWLYYVQVNKKH